MLMNYRPLKKKSRLCFIQRWHDLKSLHYISSLCRKKIRHVPESPGGPPGMNPVEGPSLLQLGLIHRDGAHNVPTLVCAVQTGNNELKCIRNVCFVLFHIVSECYIVSERVAQKCN